MKVILTLDDIIVIIGIVVWIILIIRVVVYDFILNILEKIRKHKNKKRKGVIHSERKNKENARKN